MIFQTKMRLVAAGVILATLLGCEQKVEQVEPTSTSGQTQTTTPPVAPSEVSPGAVKWPALTSAVHKNPKIEARIIALLDKMTLEEKIGQMIQPQIRQVTPDDVREFHLGSVLNGGGSTPNNDKNAAIKDWVDLADTYYHASVDKTGGRIGIPIMWGTDAVHGTGNVYGATLFPHNIGLGAMNNPDLIEKIGWATAREMAATGVDWNFSPTVAVARDDRWGRTYEAYSEDPRIVHAYAGRMIEGLQGHGDSDDLLDESHVIATVKHFIGDGGTDKGVDRGDNLSSEAQLRDIHGAGYFSAIESGVQVVMASFSLWNGDRLHGHKHLLTDVLKDQMGFDGLVVGDWSGHGFIPGCTALDCPDTINAGLDIYMVPEPKWKELFASTLKHAQSGKIPMSRINDAVSRILRVKLRAGLFEMGAPSTRALANKAGLVGAPEHRAISRQAVRESLVLLKNSQGILPLSRNMNVLVTGDGADNVGKQTAGWSVTWQGTGNTKADFPGSTSIYDGINDLVVGAGGTVQLSEAGEFKTKPDVAIVVFGENPYAEMQGDLGNVAYKNGDESDLNLLKKLRAQGIPVVSVFITGRPLWVNREINASNAFVVAWLPGTEGNGVADVLFRNEAGEVNFDTTGRLSFSWPKRVDQVVLNVGDENYDPLFAYGYGLSYSDTDTLNDDLSEVGLVKIETVDKLELFNRRAMEPWGIEIVGGENDRVVMVSNTAKASTILVETIDRNEQEDARHVVWNGTGPGHVALFVDERQDWTEYLADKSSLIFDIKVNGAPTAETYLRLGCGSYCASDINIHEYLNTLEGKDWTTVSVDLNCFSASAQHFGVRQPQSEFITQVVRPFTFYTTGELDLSFYNVRIEKHSAADAVFSCQE